MTSSNFPRYDVNPNTGEATGDTTMDPRVATNTIHHDAAYPTAILLPVLETESPRLQSVPPTQNENVGAGL